MTPAKPDQVLVCMIRVRSIPPLPAGQPPAKCDGGIDHERRNDDERHPYGKTVAERSGQRKRARAPSQQQRSRVAEKDTGRRTIPDEKPSNAPAATRSWTSRRQPTLSGAWSSNPPGSDTMAAPPTKGATSAPPGARTSAIPADCPVSGLIPRERRSPGGSSPIHDSSGTASARSAR